MGVIGPEARLSTLVFTGSFAQGVLSEVPHRDTDQQAFAQVEARLSQ